MTNLEIKLRCTNQLALLTTDTVQQGSWTRTVYVVADESLRGDTVAKQLTLIEGLQFHLYVGVPLTLDPHLLHEEMVLSFANAHYGRSAKDGAKREVVARRQELEAYQKSLRELQQQQLAGGANEEQKKLCERQEARIAGKKLELQVAEAKLVTVRNKGYLLAQYHKLLHCIDPADDEPLVPQLPPSPAKMAWMQQQMASGWRGFCCVTEHKPYDIAEQALMKRGKLSQHATWRFTFDNHQAVQHFVRKFASPFEVGVFDEEGRRVTGGGTLHQIWALGDGSRDPSLFVVPKGDSGLVQHLMQQTLPFTQKDYVYKWRWDANKVSALKHGCLEPPFSTRATGHTHVLLDSRSRQHDGDLLGYMNKYSAVARLASDGSSATDKTRHMSHCTVTFSLSELPTLYNTMGGVSINLVNIKDKQVSMSLHVESVPSPSVLSKKRTADEASLSEHAGLSKEATTSSLKPDISKKGALSLLVGHNPNKPVAAAKLTNLPGQKRVQPQGSLLLFATKKCREG